MEAFHLTTLRLTYEEAVREYEKCSDTKLGRLIANRELPILNNLVLIGAVGLILVATLPIVISGVFNASVSFGGTSLIIIVGVILETMKKIESLMVVRNYQGFLNI